MVLVLAFIGWVAIGLILLQLTAFWFLALINNTGPYNIGGVPNSTVLRVGTWVFGFVIGVLWNFWFHAAPFTITFN